MFTYVLEFKDHIQVYVNNCRVKHDLKDKITDEVI